MRWKCIVVLVVVVFGVTGICVAGTDDREIAQAASESTKAVSQGKKSEVVGSTVVGPRRNTPPPSEPVQAKTNALGGKASDAGTTLEGPKASTVSRPGLSRATTNVDSSRSGSGSKKVTGLKAPGMTQSAKSSGLKAKPLSARKSNASQKPRGTGQGAKN
jgi:hypothetical protein